MDTSKIPMYLEKGAKDKNWYQECESTLVEIFGQDQLETVALILAATSINTSLKGNITLFKRAYSEYLAGVPFSNYLPNIKNQLIRIRNGQGLSGPKINSFARSMTGDPNAVVVDIWLLRAFKLNRKYLRKNQGSKKKRGLYREGGATDKNYRIIESYIRTEAVKIGLQPREMSAMIWSGIRILEGKDSQTRYTDLLRVQYLDSLLPLNIKTPPK